MKNTRRKFFGMVLLALPMSASAVARYVDVNSASPSAPFTNWATAARTIQQAVDAAVNGDQLLVSKGTYRMGGRVVFGAMTNRVVVDKPLTVQSVNGAEVTVIQGFQMPGTINGDRAVRCVCLASGAALVGFTLTDGATRSLGDVDREQNGGGVWCASTSAVVSNCVVAGNSAQGNGGGVFGGTLYNCTLTGNHSAFRGGGAMESSLNDCMLNGNSATHGGLLCAKDITLEGVRRLLGLEREVVELYEALFFNVRGRDRLYLSSVIFGGTRLLSIRDAETGPVLTERLMMQLGRDYGWREVARWAGIIPIEDDTPIDDQVEDLHRLAFGNALMIGRAGWFNRRSEGLRYAGSLIAARPGKETQKDDDVRRGLAGMSLALSVNQSFMRIMQPQLERRLAVQRGMDIEKANQPNVTEARPPAPELIRSTARCLLNEGVLGIANSIATDPRRQGVAGWLAPGRQFRVLGLDHCAPRQGEQVDAEFLPAISRCPLRLT